MPHTSTQALGPIAVLMGGTSAERSVSLRSGQAVATSLRQAGYEVISVDIGANALQQLLELTEIHQVSQVFIALHGRGGEDGCIQGALDWLGLPYTGSGVLASALGMDKLRCKQIWQGNALPTPDYLTLDETTCWDTVIETLGLPLIVKPVHEGSSIGITKVESRAALLEAYKIAAHHDRQVMAERWISGREFTVGILDDQALPVIGLETQHQFYDYDAKYIATDTRYLLPCGLDAQQEAKIQSLAVQAFNAIGCEGWGRVDFMQDANGHFWLLEINTSPGMTDHSLVPQAAAAAGMSFQQLVTRILASAKCRSLGVEPA